MTGAASTAGTDPQGRRLYAWLGRHVLLVDGLVALLCAIVFGGIYLISRADPLGWLNTAVEVALFAPLALRRTRPFTAACAVTVPCVVQLVGKLELGPGQVAVLLIIAANAAHASRRAARAVLVAALVGILLLAFRYADTGESGASAWEPALFLVVAGWALVGVAWLAGDVTRSRRLEREALADRALQIERDRARDRELAAAEERRSIARELHDIVAHSLAVVVTQADGARYAAAGTPGPALPALEAIARTARTSLHDMRRLLGVLRDGTGAETAPAPRIDDLPALVHTVRTAGLDVRLRTAGAARPLGEGAELVAHRVVQEALTNVLKHGGDAATADVLLEWRADDLRIQVLDTGRGPDGVPSGGHGLIGMRERLAVYGGTLDFGPREGAGARLVAALPYGGRDDG